MVNDVYMTRFKKYIHGTVYNLIRTNTYYRGGLKLCKTTL